MGTAPQKSNHVVGILLLLLVGVFFVTTLYFMIRLLGSVISVAIQHTALGLLMATIVVAFLIWLIIHRRAHQNEITRFSNFPPISDDGFLQQLSIRPATPDANIALGVRRAFAKLGGVPPESLTSSMTIHDLDKLPFYDSLDQLGITFALERELKIDLPNSIMVHFWPQAPNHPPNLGQIIHRLIDQIHANNLLKLHADTPPASDAAPISDNQQS